jgi:FKBP-type peptidyl-prolyl cis-trans isomerase FkpA
MIKRNIKTLLLIFTAVVTISLTSCDPAKKYEKEENTKIQDYLNSNGSLTFVQKPSGLYYMDVQVGTGRAPVAHDTVFLKYTGKFLDGTVFDTNVGKPDSLSFPANEGWMIPGFDEGITYMKQGGKAMFLIPSKLAYGVSGYYIIDGYTPLLFDIELLLVKPGPGK